MRPNPRLSNFFLPVALEFGMIFFFVYSPAAPLTPRDGHTALCGGGLGTRDIYFGTHYPRREKSVETLLEVAGEPQNRTCFSRDARESYAHLDTKRRLR